MVELGVSVRPRVLSMMVLQPQHASAEAPSSSPPAPACLLWKSPLLPVGKQRWDIQAETRERLRDKDVAQEPGDPAVL